MRMISINQDRPANVRRTHVCIPMKGPIFCGLVFFAPRYLAFAEYSLIIGSKYALNFATYPRVSGVETETFRQENRSRRPATHHRSPLLHRRLASLRQR